MTKFWVSFWSADPSKWEYHGPWWVSGYRQSLRGEYWESSIVAAVVAKNEREVRRIIKAAHDKRHAPSEWRFISERPDGWKPFCDRFRRAKWMRWPWPKGSDDAGT